MFWHTKRGAMEYPYLCICSVTFLATPSARSPRPTFVARLEWGTVPNLAQAIYDERIFERYARPRPTPWSKRVARTPSCGPLPSPGPHVRGLLA